VTNPEQAASAFALALAAYLVRWGGFLPPRTPEDEAAFQAVEERAHPLSRPWKGWGAKYRGWSPNEEEPNAD
jgi:hypothetical protein